MSTTIAPVNNKYVLKSLEEEIGLFDRKLAHLQNFETFENEEARSIAAGKLSAKRERLIRTLRDLIDPPPSNPEASATTSKKTKTVAKTKISTRSKTSSKKAAPVGVENVAAEQPAPAIAQDSAVTPE
jgi:hypothetical protein